MTATTPPRNKRPTERPRRAGRRAPRSPEEAAQYAAWAVHKMAQGQMGVEEGKTIVALLREYSRLHELGAALKRIADLESRLQLNG